MNFNVYASSKWIVPLERVSERLEVRVASHLAHFKEYMQQKMYYTTIGFIFTAINFFLVETRFSIAGLVFGIVAAGFFIAAIRTKRE